MSVSNQALPPQPIFTKFVEVPNEMRQAVTFFLPDQEIGNLFNVCKAWNQSLQDIKERWKEDAACRRIGYDQRLIVAFRAQKISLWHLPTLDLGNRCTNPGQYVDFLTSEEMPYPVMRFEGVKGQVGIAFSIEGHAEGSITLSYRNNEKADFPIKQIKKVVAVFARLKDTRLPIWKYGEASIGASIGGIYGKLHQPDCFGTIYNGGGRGLCHTCPPLLKDKCLEWAAGIIAGKDSGFKLIDKITMVKNPPPVLLPQPLPPPLPLPPPSLTLFQKLVKKLSTPLSSFLSALVATISFLVSCCRRRE